MHSGTTAGTRLAPETDDLPCIREQTENARRLISVIAYNVDRYSVAVLEKYTEYGLAIIEGCLQTAKRLYETAGGLVGESVTLTSTPSDSRIAAVQTGICHLDTVRFHLHDILNEAWESKSNDFHRILSTAKTTLADATADFTTFTESELADATRAELEADATSTTTPTEADESQSAL